MNHICLVEGCLSEPFGMFPECKEHFQDRNRGNQKTFKWTPTSVCFLTITTILNNYPDLFSHDIKDNGLTKKSKITFTHTQCNKEYTISIVRFIAGQKCKNCIKRDKQEDVNALCIMEGCKLHRHGIFDLCKKHFIDKHAPEGNFRWFPIEICKQTIETILNNYSDILEYTVNIETLSRRTYAAIKVKHLVCGYEWDTQIRNLINEGRGCIACSNGWWTYEYVMNTLNQRKDLLVEGIEKTHLVASRTEVSVTCLECNYIWTTTLLGLIFKKGGCPSCTGVMRWDLNRLKDAMKKIERNDIIFLDVEDPVYNIKSKVYIKCADCGFEWYQRVETLVRGGGYCPPCNGTLRYSYDRLMYELRHRNDLDTTLIDPDQDIKFRSRVPLICIVCRYQWSAMVGILVRNSSGCPNCTGNVKWNLQRLLQRVNERPDINFDAVQDFHIEFSTSKIPVSCRQCFHKWSTRIACLFNSKSGCPGCRFNRAVRILLNYLNERSIVFETEKTFPGLVMKGPLRIDIYINHVKSNCYPIAIEYDGNYPGSHFSYSDEEEFIQHQKTLLSDKMKDLWLIRNDIHLIRIPYTCMKGYKQDVINEIMDKAFTFLADCSKPTLYLADVEPYQQRELKNVDCEEE